MASNKRGPRGQKRADKVKARKNKRPTAGPSAAKSVERLLEEFMASLEPEFGAASVEVTALTHATLDTLMESSPSFRPTAWVADDVHDLLDKAEDSEDPDTGNAMVASAVAFLSFLDETRRWTGSRADLDHCLRDLTEFLDSADDAVEVERPDVEPEVELAALTALPVIGLFDELLESIGQPVMGAAIPDLDADGRRVWDAAVDSELLDDESGRAYRGRAAEPFEARDLSVVRDAVAAFVRQFFLDYVGPGAELVEAATQATFEYVLSAMTDAPPSPPDDTGDKIQDLALNVVRATLSTFVDQKLLTLGDHFVVPMAVRPAVLDGLAEYDERRFGSTVDRFTLKATIDGSAPEVWRRLVVDSDTSLAVLHLGLAAAFGWDDETEHSFASRGQAQNDEDTVALESVYHALGDSLVYSTPNHTVTVVVEHDDPIDETAPIVECVDGGPESLDLDAINDRIEDHYS